jgi:hypothetical protein
MSNQIPDLNPSERPEEVPYCIWHPDVASEDTYRQLVRRYPEMAYQVGRACAVAGYTELFLELDILPEISIAEEARAVEGNSDTIFRHIMTKPARYRIMNDYTRTVSTTMPTQPAFLNGDTAVRRHLDFRQRFERPSGTRDPDDPDHATGNPNPWRGMGFVERQWDITEDMCIDELDGWLPINGEDEGSRPSEDTMVDRLCMPLGDLPAGK